MLTHDEIVEVMKAHKGRSMLEFAQAIDAVAVRKVSDHGPICGENHAVDADLAGCGKPIRSQYEVYRCTDCGVPFHRLCAVKHFTTDTPEDGKVIPLITPSLMLMPLQSQEPD